MPAKQVLPERLQLAIQDLDDWALGQGLQIELVVVGAVALFLSDVEVRFTQDIDTLTELDDRLLEAIVRIGERHGLGPCWLNDQAHGLSVPEGFQSGLTKRRVGRQVTLLVPSRKDLIALKAAAFVIRGGEDPKDFSDLLALGPTRDEIDFAIRFVRKEQTPPHPRFFPDFEEVLLKLYDTVR